MMAAALLLNLVGHQAGERGVRCEILVMAM